MKSTLYTSQVSNLRGHVAADLHLVSNGHHNNSPSAWLLNFIFLNIDSLRDALALNPVLTLSMIHIEDSCISKVFWLASGS